MGENIIMMFCCLPCSITFTILGIESWRKKTPVHFWSGTKVTAEEVTDVKAYNRANARMWFVYSVPYWTAAFLSVKNGLLAGIILGVACTFGTITLAAWYALWIEKKYKWKYVQFHQSVKAEQEKSMQIPRTKTKLEKNLDIASTLILAGTVLWMAAMWKFLPDEIPRHYNVLGEADAWSGKGILIFNLAMEAGMYLMMLTVKKIPGMWSMPQKKTEEEQKKVYDYCGNMIAVLNLVIVVMFTYMTVCSALGKPLGSGFILFSLAGTFVPIIYYMIKMY